jgi:hypothetical protein
MFRLSSPTFWALMVLALGGALSTCAQPPDRAGPAASVQYSAEEAGELLQGTWLREYTSEGVQVRRVLTLTPRGEFQESARVTDAAGRVTEFVHEGTWLYDGTNLKRKYTSMNGKPPSRLNVPFATFEIAFESRNEFTGVDHIHDHRIRYRRVGSEAAP